LDMFIRELVYHQQRWVIRDVGNIYFSYVARITKRESCFMNRVQVRTHFARRLFFSGLHQLYVYVSKSMCILDKWYVYSTPSHLFFFCCKFTCIFSVPSDPAYIEERT
jgi:hypothetical protein